VKAIRATNLMNKRQSHSDTQRSTSEDEQLNNLRNAIGARLRGYRIHRNMSGVALARAAGISAAMLSKIEAAARIPSVPLLASLATALQLEIGDLFGSTAGLKEPVYLPASRSDAKAHQSKDGGLVSIEQLGVVELQEMQIRLLRVRAAKGCSATKPVQFDGFWIDHVIEGEIVLCIGGRDYHLRRGDTLTYRGEVPHYVKAFPAGATELLVVQGWINTNASRVFKLDGALLG
jgi:transcriptional regulator with XRE-family HTH domain